MIKCKKTERGIGTMIYTVIKIEGEYATLSDDKNGEELFIALALLPENTDIGAKLLYENMEFTII